MGDIKDLQILQNKVAQIVMHSSRRENRNRMYDKLNWLSVNQLISYFTLLAVFRVRATREPEYLSNVFHNVNRSGSIIVRNTRLTLYKESFGLRGARSWNDLPVKIRNIEKIGLFKIELRKWIKQNVRRFLA